MVRPTSPRLQYHLQSSVNALQHRASRGFRRRGAKLIQEARTVEEATVSWKADWLELIEVLQLSLRHFLPAKFEPDVEAEFSYHISRGSTVIQMGLSLIVTGINTILFAFALKHAIEADSSVKQAAYILHCCFYGCFAMFQWVLWIVFKEISSRQAMRLFGHAAAHACAHAGTLAPSHSHAHAHAHAYAHARAGPHGAQLRRPSASPPEAEARARERWPANPISALGCLNGMIYVTMNSFTQDRLIKIIDPSTSWREEVSLPLDPNLRCRGYCDDSVGDDYSCDFRNLETTPLLASVAFLLYLSIFQRMNSGWYLCLALYFVSFYTFARGFWGDLDSLPTQYLFDALALGVLLLIVMLGVRRNEQQIRANFTQMRSAAMYEKKVLDLERKMAQTETVNDAYEVLAEGEPLSDTSRASTGLEPFPTVSTLAGVSALTGEQTRQRLGMGLRKAGLLHAFERQVRSGQWIPARPDELMVPPPPELRAEEELGPCMGLPGFRIRQCLPDLPPGASSAQQEKLAEIARHIRDPDYNLASFHADCIEVFPEMQLYLVSPPRGLSTTSGRTPSDEYRRTIGALFAVYWLLRLDMDGKRGFCFGVNEGDWRPIPENKIALLSQMSVPEQLVPDFPARHSFLAGANWELLTQLLLDAELLEPAPGAEQDNGQSPRRPRHVINVERTMAMLTLTAIHDIMKIEHLLPTVRPEHAPYNGYEAGELIRDHDVALGYVLQHDAEALPCYAALDEKLRTAVRFTQAELGFNHGWLVQAEAPPGILFSRFRLQIQEHGVSASEIAFYFVHWVTDLAGAEPKPLSGSDKFVVKFPKKVFDRIVRSMPVVQRLAHTPPARLYEEFLREEWDDVQADLGVLQDLAMGATAVALMRLVVQAQDVANQHAVRDAFLSLPSGSQTSLSRELALTGVDGERFSLSPDVGGGPAFLMYYSPAFVRHCCAQGSEDGYAALVALLEICRAAREIWPLTPEHQGQTVTLFVGELRSCNAKAILSELAEGNCWVLERTGQQEGTVRLLGVEAVREMPATHLILRFWRSELAPPNLKIVDPTLPPLQLGAASASPAPAGLDASAPRTGGRRGSRVGQTLDKWKAHWGQAPGAGDASAHGSTGAESTATNHQHASATATAHL